MEKRTLLADNISHDCSKRRDALALHLFGINIGMLFKRFEDEIAVRIRTQSAERLQRQGRIEPGEINDDVAQRAA